MPDEMIVMPENPEDDSGPESKTNNNHNNHDAGRAADNGVPSREACQKAIAALPGLVAIRVLQPAQANSIRASYERILREYDRDRSAQRAHIPDGDLSKVYEQHPDVIDLIAPLLNAEQLQLLVDKAKVRRDGQA
jgi:hypothetical protein